MCNYSDEESIAYKLRVERGKKIIAMIDRTFLSLGGVKIADIGGSEKYWSILPKGYLKARNVSITIINLGDECKIIDHSTFDYIKGDGRNLTFIPNNTFDLLHSNSVIEHVGCWECQQDFANEVNRISKSYYIQTPYFYFPIDPHSMIPFFQFLSDDIKIRLLENFDIGHYRKQNREGAIEIVDSTKMLNRQEFETLFPNANVEYEKFLGIPKSLIAIKELQWNIY